MLAYGDEVEQLSAIRVGIVDPGATATRMRASAFPGEDAGALQQPAAVGAAIARLVVDDFQTGHRVRIGG